MKNTRGISHTATGNDQALVTALAHLRTKLLDLSSRNKLLNMKRSSRSYLPFTGVPLEALCQQLLNDPPNTGVSLQALPDPPLSEWSSEGEDGAALSRPAPLDWARMCQINADANWVTGKSVERISHLQTIMYEDSLGTRCRYWKRQAELAFEETGANILYLIVGFLEYPVQSKITNKQPDKYIAPLINIPVNLASHHSLSLDARQAFTIQYMGDDIPENLSLKEKLASEQGILLPDFTLDAQSSTEAIKQYLNAIELRTHKLEGFHVHHHVGLALLSFTKMLLYRDLNPDNWIDARSGKNLLLSHPIVRDLLIGGPSPKSPSRHQLTSDRLDETAEMSMPLVYDADSSQHNALLDILNRNRNLVIQGPPGTGKSQTITNLIAASLADGKTILFIADKMAALEVVRNRVAAAGLGHFLLELHSNKTNKTTVFRHLHERIELGESIRPRHASDLDKLKTYRKNLIAYTDLLHNISHNRCELTLHDTIWRCQQYGQRLEQVRYSLRDHTIRDATQLTQSEIDYRADALKHLGEAFGVLPSGTSQALVGLNISVIAPSDVANITNLLLCLQVAVARFANVADRLTHTLSEPVRGVSVNALEAHLQDLNTLQMLELSQDIAMLVPLVFRDDIMGGRACMVLSALQEDIDAYHLHTSTIEQSLQLHDGLTMSQLNELHELAKVASDMGASLGSLREMSILKSTLEHALGRATHALHTSSSFLMRMGIGSDGRRPTFEKLRILSDLFANAPIEDMHLQCPGLQAVEAEYIVRRLADDQGEWRAREAALQAILYLDDMPEMDNLKDALRILRAGDAWYRLFQPRWRAAVATHRYLQRHKHQVSADERVSDLEKVITLYELQQKWCSAPTWKTLLGIDKQVAAYDVSGIVRLSVWNTRIREALHSVHWPNFIVDHATPDEILALCNEFKAYQNVLIDLDSTLATLEGCVAGVSGLLDHSPIEQVVKMVEEFHVKLVAQIAWLSIHANHAMPYDRILSACDASCTRDALLASIRANSTAMSLLGVDTLDSTTDLTCARSALTWGMQVISTGIPTQMKEAILWTAPLKLLDQLVEIVSAMLTDWNDVLGIKRQLCEYGDVDLAQWTGVSDEDDVVTFAQELVLRSTNAVKYANSLLAWSDYVSRRSEAQKLHLQDFIALLEQHIVPPTALVDAYSYCIHNTIVLEIFKHNRQVANLSGLHQDRIRKDFQILDRAIIKARSAEIANRSIERAHPPQGTNQGSVVDKTEMSLLKYVIPQRRPRLSLRHVLTKAPAAVQALTPCFLMGPQSVAQFLPPTALSFDLVIMDEASQLRPEEAIGAIARGRQLVVVGDSHQLPPTSFFTTHALLEDEDDRYVADDAESILDVCAANLRHSRTLRWHYRSKHHSLIDFSNHHFYNGNLIVFPSPYQQTAQLGITAVYIANSQYENQSNIMEAQRVIKAVLDHARSRPDESLGIVTLNMKQADLIAELLDKLETHHAHFEAYRATWQKAGQPLFVKNLENVQGDERDAIIISTTFGKDPQTAKVRQNFGPISTRGGGRRLNVLFTRARASILLVTSLRPEDIHSTVSTPAGTKILRQYLEYIRTGYISHVRSSDRGPESPFESAVIRWLENDGYCATPQLGVAGYRIDIAVEHPKHPGMYIAAIECDGATYHSALSIRDRDRIRQEVLESLGWKDKIWRIWSTDWFKDPGAEMDKLRQFLDELTNSTVYTDGASSSFSRWVEESGPFITLDADMHIG